MNCTDSLGLFRRHPWRGCQNLLGDNVFVASLWVLECCLRLHVNDRKMIQTLFKQACPPCSATKSKAQEPFGSIQILLARPNKNVAEQKLKFDDYSVQSLKLLESNVWHSRAKMWMQLGACRSLTLLSKPFQTPKTKLVVFSLHVPVGRSSRILPTAGVGRYFVCVADAGHSWKGFKDQRPLRQNTGREPGYLRFSRNLALPLKAYSRFASLALPFFTCLCEPKVTQPSLVASSS